MKVFDQIIVIDKKIPQISLFSKKYLHIFDDKKIIKFHQIDISSKEEMQKIFKIYDKIDFIVYLAAETRPNMPNHIYEKYNAEMPIQTAAICS